MLNSPILSYVLLFSFIILMMLALVAESLFMMIRRHEVAIRRFIWKWQFALLSRVLAFVLWMNRIIDLVFGHTQAESYRSFNVSVIEKSNHRSEV